MYTIPGYCSDSAWDTRQETAVSSRSPLAGIVRTSSRLLQSTPYTVLMRSCSHTPVTPELFPPSDQPITTRSECSHRLTASGRSTLCDALDFTTGVSSPKPSPLSDGALFPSHKCSHSSPRDSIIMSALVGCPARLAPCPCGAGLCIICLRWRWSLVHAGRPGEKVFPKEDDLCI